MNKPNTTIFSKEAIEALQEFGTVLLKIRAQMIAEGKEIEVDEHYRTDKKPTG